jgi:hypothetical protein
MTFLDRVIGKDIVLEAHPLPLDPIKADLAQVEQVLMNLCIKARGAMPRSRSRQRQPRRPDPRGLSPRNAARRDRLLQSGARTSASRAKFAMRKDSGSQAAQVM